MAKVIITEELFSEIEKTFDKPEANRVIDLMESLEQNPKKGKEITCLGSVVLKEIKYKSWRFYFLTDGFKVKFLKIEQLNDLLIKFIRMSSKKEQQKTIDEIKKILRMTGEESLFEP